MLVLCVLVFLRHVHLPYTIDLAESTRNGIEHDPSNMLCNSVEHLVLYKSIIQDQEV